MSQHYDHPLAEAHLVPSAQVSALVRKVDERR
jgi:hypothetical protein